MLRSIPVVFVLLGLCMVLILMSLFSITLGAMNIQVQDSLVSLLRLPRELPPSVDLVIQQIRLPRTLLCALVGAILAVCGAVMQGLFRNPLAEPGIIGVSAGASLGAAIVIVLLAQLPFRYPELELISLPFSAFIGGTLTTLLVYKLGTNQFGTSVIIMLLAGVAISALSGAGIGYLNYLASDQMLRDLTLWSMGSLAGANWSNIALCALTLGLILVYFCRHAMALNALLLGEAEARHLGVPLQKLKRRLILFTAMGVGVTISTAGMIGFIGLVVPHLGRMLVGPDHRSLIPVSALLGALLLMSADMYARVALAPAELPVGIVTALIGAPFFLYLLFQQKGKLF